MKKLLTDGAVHLDHRLRNGNSFQHGRFMLFEEHVPKIEGKPDTVHDSAGNDIRFHIDKARHLKGDIFKADDKVETHVTEQDYVPSMIHMTVSDTVARPGSKIVEGDVLKPKGVYDIVRQRSRQDARLHVDLTTHLEDGAFRVRDKLQAYVTDKGHVRYQISISHNCSRRWPRGTLSQKHKECDECRSSMTSI